MGPVQSSNRGWVGEDMGKVQGKDKGGTVYISVQSLLVEGR